ncbi:prolyl oligopeptidase family serine peptidase [Kriegella sp. EG-1]|nr:prolyl oligopeptidase family serine peptidase [Flavobacteriaceae bacterium EG-1]
MGKIKSGEIKSRRDFIKKSAFACAAFPFISRVNTIIPVKNQLASSSTTMNIIKNKSIIGGYGDWAANLLKEVPELSFRNDSYTTIESWKSTALEKVKELVAAPKLAVTSQISVDKKYNYDGLEVEELSWQLSSGTKRTNAILLRPIGVKGKLPAILGLHDHGGNKYFGKRKITKVSDNEHPLMSEHQNQYYEGFAWANEIAKRGYVVMVHDVFTFGSRRVLLNDVEGILWGGAINEGLGDNNPEEAKNIETYNNWAAEHEHVLSKSLFCAGTTWPGVTFAEDQIALNVLASRSHVDENNIGCAGLSGGGLRTNYLAGLDHRVKCAVSVGFMSTWQDFLLHKSFTHTWMLYAPLLSKYIEFPELIGLRAPLPTLVLNNNQDSLYTLTEMQKADAILSAVYKKMNASEKYRANFYEGPHKFDKQMQLDAFNWFDKWMKG